MWEFCIFKTKFFTNITLSHFTVSVLKSNADDLNETIYILLS